MLELVGQVLYTILREVSMLETKEVSELVTKADFNKLMGYKAADVPKEDKKEEGYVVTFQDTPVWLPKEAYEASVVADILIEVAGNPSVFARLSPLKQKRVLQAVKDSL